VRVAGLRDGWSYYKTLTGCSRNNRLFVCDSSNIYKVDISINHIVNWRVDGWPTGLSVNDAGHVIVTCYYGNEIREYEPEGQLVRTIKLQSHVTRPFHALQLTDCRFIVSHWGPYGVSSMDTQGQVIQICNYSVFTKLLYYPTQITVVKNGSVLVVDRANDPLVLLDASLRNARELTVPIPGRLRGTGCLYFDESLSRLYVVERYGERIVLYDNFIIE